jgi:Siphovirus-type tail component, C-terminal domain
VITSIEITNSRGNTLRLPIFNSSGGYEVKDIEGLDPVNATLTTTSLAQVDGAQAQSSRRSTRNITMKLGFVPDYKTTTVQSLRSALYDYLFPQANIVIGVYLDGILFAKTSGQVESFDNVLFSSDPEVAISIICYDPDLYSPSLSSIDGNTSSSTSTNEVPYDGTSKAGVIFTLSVNRALTSFTLYNTTPENIVQSFAVTGSFESGDVITINSIPGSKRATLLRAGIQSSILASVDPASSWISLGKGTNRFRCYASGAAIPYNLSYTEKYGGI